MSKHNLQHFAKWNRGGRHKWITKAIAAALPDIGDTRELKAEQTKVHLKLFNPTGAGSWFITEADLETGEAYGYADLQLGPGCAEMGYLDLNELRAYKGRFGLGIERDERFTATLAEVMGKRAA